MTDNINAYILQAIDTDGYDVEVNTPEEKLQFLRNTFVSEYGWHIQQVGEINALTGWLQGLPSSINIDFYNHDIIKRGVELGLLDDDASEKRIDQFLNRWFAMLAMRIKGLWNLNGINTTTKG